MPKAIQLDHLTQRGRNARVLLDSVQLTIAPGSFVAVLGENGAGKTTLLDLLMGFRGRRRLLESLAEANRRRGATIVLATNILEDLAQFLSHVCLLHRGRILRYATLAELLAGRGPESLSEKIVEALEGA